MLNADSPRKDDIEGKDESMCITQIKAKYIPDTRILKIVLDKKLGEGQFHVEMRQNIYTIRSH
ncbi:hypothetical protein F4806DRAFT_482526 [Annulohypoxylon nitens]|nr:hypothetical protein F4806DRAFT_482526 [Annulohypoxylon nitens]